MEIWKTIPETNGRHEISSEGRVRIYNGRLLSLLRGPNDKYYSVRIKIGGKRKHARIDYLVAENFVPNPNNKELVRYKNRNLEDISAANLEWTTKEEELQLLRSGLKTCTKCRIEKPLSEYFTDRANKAYGKTPRCKACLKKQNSHVYKMVAVENYKYQQIKYSTGVERADYELLVETCNNSCAICGKTEEENGKRLSIDHCHITKKVRGLLCSTCNLGLGAFRDNENLLNLAIEYLKDNHSSENILFKEGIQYRR